jgi:fucose 4-O-acetylase-like acetyltransferase
MIIEKYKNPEIETLRGIACILLVSFHVIGGTAAQGMRVDDDSLARFLNDLFIYLRMPMFAFISGYIYGQFSMDKEKYFNFYVGKIRRLGIPMITVTTLFLIGAHIVDNEYALPFAEMYKAYLFSYAHFWYLQASLIIFLIVLILDYFNFLNSKGKAITIFAFFSCLSILADNISDFFSLNGAIYILPYFLLGLYLKRFNQSFSKTQILTISTLTAIQLLIVTLVSLKINIDFLEFNIDKHSVFGITTSVLCCLFVYVIKTKSSILEKIGYYSFAIYLYHVFFTSGWRMIGDRIELNDLVMFVSSLIFGLMMPIFLQKIAKKIDLLNLIFLGEKLRKQSKSKGE